VVVITKSNLYDTTSRDIILISYPPGGFGHFIYYVLSEFADRTVKIDNSQFKFSGGGNSHSALEYTNVFWHDPDAYDLKLLATVDVSDRKILVRCDPGLKIPGDLVYTKTDKIFPNATVIRNILNDNTAFLIYDMALKKIVDNDIFQSCEESINLNWSDSSENYARREFYTLAYRNLKSNKIFSNLCRWQFLDKPNLINFSLEDLIADPYQSICSLIKRLDMKVVQESKLKTLCAEWSEKHLSYTVSYSLWPQIEHALDTNLNFDLSNITDLKTQGYINYRIEEKFNIKIPVYDYKNWFKDIHEINEMIGKISIAE
jgi:hypothetical protein